MSLENQAEILCAIAKKIITESSGNWLLYATYRPANGIDDNLTKECECYILNTEEKVANYLCARIETYNPKIGMFIDVACETVDIDGNIDWCHVGFANESMDLIIDHYDNNQMIENMSIAILEQPTNLLKNTIFAPEKGYALFCSV